MKFLSVDCTTASTLPAAAALATEPMQVREITPYLPHHVCVCVSSVLAGCVALRIGPCMVCSGPNARVVDDMTDVVLLRQHRQLLQTNKRTSEQTKTPRDQP
jgi:hypothetical protein